MMRRALKSQVILSIKKSSALPSTGNVGADGFKLSRHIKSFLDRTPGGKDSDDRIHGFFRGLALDLTGSPVEALANPQKASATEAIWKGKIRQTDPTPAFLAHQIVVSVEKDKYADMIAKNFPVDDELHHIVSTTMLRYQEKFYPGHQLSYLVGLRHDRRDPEVRILLYPQTDKGKPLNFSDSCRVTFSDGSTESADFFGFIKNTVEQLGVEMYFDRFKTTRRHFGLLYEEVIQDMLLSSFALSKCTGEMKPVEADGVPNSRQVLAHALVLKRQMLRRPDLTVRPVLEAEYGSRAAAWAKASPKDAEKAVSDALDEKAGLIEDIRKLTDEPAAAHAPDNVPSNQLRSIRRDAYRAQEMLLGWRKLKWGSPLFTDTSDRRWCLSRMRKNDELGQMIARAHDLRDDNFTNVDRYPQAKRMSGTVAMKKSAVIQQHLAEMQRLNRLRIEETRRDLEGVRKAKEEKSEQLARYRIGLQCIAMKLIDARATIAGHPPRYLQQFNTWMKSGRIVRVSLARTERPDQSMASNDALTVREQAVRTSAPATADDYRTIRVKSPPPTQQPSTPTTEGLSGQPTLQRPIMGIREEATSPTLPIHTELRSSKVNTAPFPVPIEAKENPIMSASEIAREGKNSHVKPVPAIAQVDTPWFILTQPQGPGTVERALAKYREAIRLILKVPHNDCIDHAALSPWLSVDDPNSFDGLHF